MAVWSLLIKPNRMALAPLCFLQVPKDRGLRPYACLPAKAFLRQASATRAVRSKQLCGTEAASSTISIRCLLMVQMLALRLLAQIILVQLRVLFMALERSSLPELALAQHADMSS